MAAFTTKSMTQQGSPYTPPGHRSKGGGSRYRTRGVVSTVSSNHIVLTTLGSIHPDPMDVDLEQDVVELDDINEGFGMDLGSLSTAIGGDDGEPLPDGDDMNSEHEGNRPRRRVSPAPAYNSLDHHNTGRLSYEDQSCSTNALSIVNGIRIDVEQATTEM